MRCPARRHENPSQAKFPAYREAVTCFEQALAALHPLLDTHQKVERAIDLRLERGNEAWALRLLGDIASHHDRPDVTTAAAHYGAAMTLASELDMRPLVAPTAASASAGSTGGRVNPVRPGST